MNRLRRFVEHLPLQRKLFWLIGLAVLSSLLVGLAALIAYDLTTIRPRAIDGASGQVQGLAEVVAAAVEFDDEETAAQHLEAFGRLPGVRALAIVLSDGTIFAQHRAANAPPFDPRRPAEHLAGNLVAVDAELPSHGAPLGAIHMVKELRPVSSRVIEYAALFGVAALSLIALTILLSTGLRHTITEPVEELASAARDVAERRDYHLRVHARREDEIGQLATQVNAMLAAIEQHQTALKHSEETARRQLAEIDNIYQNAAVGLCLIDRNLSFVRLNKLFAAMNECTVEDAVNRTTTEATPALARAFDRIYRRILDTGETVAGVEFLRTDAGAHGPRHFLVSNYPLSNSSGEIVGVTGVMIEVTDQRHAELERASLEAQLRQSQKMQALGTLAGGIAHDFNNVLTAISGNARLALEDLPDDHAAAISLGEISRGAERAKDLVRRILAFSRQEQADRRPIDLRPIVDEALRLLRATVPTMIEFRLESAPDLPKVLADATQVHQVLMNLGTNACDAMRERGGVLTVRLEDFTADALLQLATPDLQPGRYLRVRVTDTGVGISRDVLERVFDPFFTTKPPGEGTGLGLSVVHGIMRSHGGAVLLHSERDRGSEFDLYFPAMDADAKVAVEPESPDVAPQGRGEHILYVDDEESLVFLVTRMMERMGYRITGLTNASAAIDAVRSDPLRFDLVITDLGMPGMSGMDLAEELLRIRADLPVIITSGYVRADDMQRAEEIGVRDVVLKPGTVAEMGQLIRQRLS